MSRRTSMKRPVLNSEDRFDPAEVAALDLNALVERIREYDVRTPIVPSVQAAMLNQMLPETLPAEGRSLDEAIRIVWDIAVEYGRRNRHPGFFGYVCSPGLPTDVVGNTMATVLNQNVTGFSSAPGATTIELQFIRWMAELVGLPNGAGGLLLSGGSNANLLALTTALHKAAGPALRTEGLAEVSKDGAFTLYIADTTHFSVERATLLLGIGRKHIRNIPVDSNFCMIPAALNELLHSDRAEGFRPFCVVASAGSTTTGSIDPLDQIADICREHSVWMHVDGAYGAAAMFALELRRRLKGIERADSVSMDLHKWMFLSFDGSALLLRDPESAHHVFYTFADYVQIPQQPPPEAFAFFHYGPETSRRDRALGAVLALLHYGSERLGRNILHNVRCAEYLADLVRKHPSLTLLSQPQLSICCFRFDPATLGDAPERVDNCNAEIRRRLQEEGEFYLSETMLGGRPALRLCILNPATGAEHIEAFVQRVIEIGNEAS